MTRANRTLTARVRLTGPAQRALATTITQTGPFGVGSPVGPASLCNNGPTNPPNAQNLPKALLADNSYLAQLPMSGDPSLLNPAPFAVWNYWYSDVGGSPVCTLFDNTYGAITDWKSIETRNGGG